MCVTCFALPASHAPRRKDAGVLGGAAARARAQPRWQAVDYAGLRLPLEGALFERGAPPTPARTVPSVHYPGKECEELLLEAITGKEREELLLEARVQRELRTVPAVPAAALGVLCLVVVEACDAFGQSLVSLCPLLVGRVGALRERQVRAHRAARVSSLAARLPELAGRTRQPLRAAVDAAPFDKEELLAALPHADALVALHPVRAVEHHFRRALCALDALGALLERGTTSVSAAARRRASCCLRMCSLAPDICRC